MKASASQALQHVRTTLAYQLTPEAVSELLEPIQEALEDDSVIPVGWKLVLVNEGFYGLMDSLERAHRKGYMPDAITEDYEGFDYSLRL